MSESRRAASKARETSMMASEVRCRNCKFNCDKNLECAMGLVSTADCSGAEFVE